MACLYLQRQAAQDLSTEAVVTRLRRVFSLLDAILQSDRSLFLEARTWLLSSIAEQAPSAELRLACWEPLLTEATASDAHATRGPIGTPDELGQGRGGCSASPERLQYRRRDAFGAGTGGGGAGGGGEVRQHEEGEVGRASPGGGARGPHDAGPGSEELLMQLLMLVSEVWPEKVADVLLDQPQVFIDFFQGPGSSRRIALWFSHFSMEGMRAFKYGAYALAHYALIHREEMWDLLQWEGKHPQAPVAVASKTHYFAELALQPSVRALLRRHPAFWASEQWREACRDGAFLELDRRHFCQVLLSQMRGGGPAAGRMAALLRSFLAASPSPWQLLCQRLLHQLSDSALLRLVNTLAAAQPLPPPPEAAAPQAAPAAAAAAVVTRYAGVCGSGGWLDLSGLVLRGGVAWGRLGEAVVAHALAASRGRLQRLLWEERGELGGRMEELAALGRELHGEAGTGAGRAEGCSAEAHCALLSGGRLRLLGRHSAGDRALLLAELWTLREALRSGNSAITSGAEAEEGVDVVPLRSAAQQLPLELVMSGVGGIRFERLHGGGGGGTSDGGGDGGGRGGGADAAGSSGAAAVRRGSAAAAVTGAVPESTAAASRYELLPSEDEDQDGHRRRRRRKKRKSKSDRGDKRDKRSRKRRRRSRSSHRSRDRDPRRSDGSSSEEEEQVKGRDTRRLRGHRGRSRSRSSSSPSRSRSRDGIGLGNASEGSTERCRSRTKSGKERNGRRRDSLGKAGSEEDDSSELLDPLAALQRGVMMHVPGLRHDGDAGGVVWRVQMLGAEACGGDGGGGGGGSGAGAGEEGLAAVREMLGGCDEVADLLAAVACKHWVALLLREGRK